MLDSILKALRLAPRFFFAAWVFGAIILFAPDRVLTTVGVTVFRDAHRQWIGPVALASFVVWLTHTLVSAWHWLSVQIRHRLGRKAVVSSLSTLSQEELELLAYFVYRGAPTQSLILGLPPARSLEEKGLLGAVSGTGNMFGWPYTIPDYVWRDLQARRAELFPTLDSPETRSHFDNYDRRMHDLALYGR